MRKRGLAALMIALMLAMGTGSVTAAAAEGWAQEGSSWVYYDSSGDKVYNAWRRGGDNLWRYVDGNGVMATNCWVDDEYYVDADGIMYTDKWLKLTDEDGDTQWYYFSGTGKAVKDNWKKINDKWYHFDDDGVMETGWVDDDMYYCDASGVMLTGWQHLYSPDEEEERQVTPGENGLGDDDELNWYYFSSSGKKYLPDEDETSGDYGTRKIEGYYYCLDEDGAMQTGWQNVRSNNDETILDFMYFDQDGKGRTGWYSMYPPEELGGYDGEVEWFYFNNSGEPRAAESEKLTDDDIYRINGKSYLFNELGNPVWGLRKVYISDDEWTAFYFGGKTDDKEKLSMQTGEVTVTEGDGSRSDFYFGTNGRGYTGVKDNHLYYKGKMQKAVEGTKYMCYDIDGKYYVVNKTGKVMRNDEVKDADGVKLETNSSGILIKADGETNIEGYVNEPEEPIWNED